MGELLKTVLHEKHVSLGATMVDFGGWHMPLQYKTGIVEEHLATRKGAGIFDVSHMGRFIVRGSGALAFLQHVLSNNAAALDTGFAQYTMIPNVEGACRSLGIMEAFAELPEGIRGKTSPSTLLQMFLLFVHGVATMDRKSFGRIGAEPFHYLRLSIATGTEDLKKGLARIAAGVADRDGFRRFVAAGEHFF